MNLKTDAFEIGTGQEHTEALGLIFQCKTAWAVARLLLHELEHRPTNEKFICSFMWRTRASLVISFFTVFL